MKFEEVLKEALAEPTQIATALNAKYAGTDNPHMVDWASGKKGKKKKKKIVRRKLHGAVKI